MDSKRRATVPAERDLGPQPLARLMEERGLKAADLVTASSEQLTFKAVARALQGRWLTPNMRGKVRRAFVAASGTECTLAELFTYARDERDGRDAQRESDASGTRGARGARAGT